MARVKHLTENEYIEALLNAWEARPQSMHHAPNQKWHPEDLYYNLDTFISGVTAALAAQKEEPEQPPVVLVGPQHLRVERDPLIPSLYWLWAGEKAIQLYVDGIELDEDRMSIYVHWHDQNNVKGVVRLQEWLQRVDRAGWTQEKWEDRKSW